MSNEPKVLKGAKIDPEEAAGLDPAGKRTTYKTQPDAEEVEGQGRVVARFACPWCSFDKIGRLWEKAPV